MWSFSDDWIFFPPTRLERLITLCKEVAAVLDYNCAQQNILLRTMITGSTAEYSTVLNTFHLANYSVCGAL